MFSALRPLACCGLLLLALAARAEDEVTLTSGEWLPYISENLPDYGPVSRIVSEAFALEGVRVRYVFRPWGRAYVEAANDSANGTLVWAMLRNDGDRVRRFYFSEAVVDGPMMFFHLKRMPFAWSGDDRQLETIRVGGTAGYEYFFERDPNIKIDRAAATDALNFRKLLAGRFDVFPADLNVGREIMRTRMTPAEAALITWDPKPASVAHYYLLLNKKNPKNLRYMALFNKGLKRLKESGRHADYLRELK